MIVIRTRRALILSVSLLIVLGVVIFGGYKIYQNLRGNLITKDRVSVGTSINDETFHIQGENTKFPAGQSIVVFPEWKETTDTHSDELKITNVATHKVVLDKQWEQLYPGSGIEIHFREKTRGNYQIQFYRDTKLKCSKTITFY